MNRRELDHAAQIKRWSTFVDRFATPALRQADEAMARDCEPGRGSREAKTSKGERKPGWEASGLPSEDLAC
jgi:hypothetical protein